ncbi:hypothetical protein GGR55DRAFT_535508 [Xylaria sp. FL0064]|nr:hypothetical protein GGR55DRAFT_535508 [Xylaria sp. FL0064]
MAIWVAQFLYQGFSPGSGSGLWSPVAEYFRVPTKCLQVIYFDLWPFLSCAHIYATRLEPCYQTTQEKAQLRHGLFAWAMRPVIGGKDQLW